MDGHLVPHAGQAMAKRMDGAGRIKPEILGRNKDDA
jgi:hypothetical protein